MLPTADFFDYEALLSTAERAKLAQLREFLAAEVAPFATDWWNKAEFPAHILPKLAALELSAPAQRGYSNLFAGIVIAEMTRVDTSLATFFLVHHDLFVESLYGFGSEEQKARLLEDAASLRTTGAFALTEPDHGSDVAGGMETRARRVPGGAAGGGDAWVLNGAKRWIGNGTFCDYMLVWARDEADGGIRGFIVDATLPGVSRSRIENKIALRTVQNADIVFTDVRVAETDRFAGISSFEDTNELLRGSRIMVAWQGVGQQLAAFDVARQYAVERQQFGRPLAKFQLVQQQLVTMLGNAVASMGMMVRIAQLQDAGAGGHAAGGPRQVLCQRPDARNRRDGPVPAGRQRDRHRLPDGQDLLRRRGDLHLRGLVRDQHPDHGTRHHRGVRDRLEDGFDRLDRLDPFRRGRVPSRRPQSSHQGCCSAPAWGRCRTG